MGLDELDWQRVATCESKGEACLIARLWTDHHSANGYHPEVATRVVDLKSSFKVCVMRPSLTELETMS